MVFCRTVAKRYPVRRFRSSLSGGVHMGLVKVLRVPRRGKGVLERPSDGSLKRKVFGLEYGFRGSVAEILCFLFVERERC